MSSDWSRDGATDNSVAKDVNVVVHPYSAGPQTISTPFGDYIKVDSSQTYSQGLSKYNT